MSDQVDESYGGRQCRVHSADFGEDIKVLTFDVILSNWHENLTVLSAYDYGAVDYGY